MLNRKAAALLMSAVLLLSMLLTGAYAESAADLGGAMPLVDLTVSSAVRVGEYPEFVAEDGFVSTAFTQNFFRDGVSFGIGITDDMAADTEKQAAYMEKVFIPGAAELAAVEDTNAPADYIGLYPISRSFDESTGMGVVIGNVYSAPAAYDKLTAAQMKDLHWMDLRMLVSVAIDPESPAGWRMLAFNWDAPAIIDAVQEYMDANMLEYVNADAGYSILYPAAFDESAAAETETGLEGKLPDGKATFFVKSGESANGKEAEDIVRAMAEGDDSADFSNDFIGTWRVVRTDENGNARMNLVIVYGDVIYEAELCYASELALEYSLFSDYMMNSFTVDEIGVG